MTPIGLGTAEQIADSVGGGSFRPAGPVQQFRDLIPLVLGFMSSTESRCDVSIGVVFDHVTLQVGDVAASRGFYEALLLPLGIRAEYTDGDAVGFIGPVTGSFWICPTQGPETRELHVAFSAPDRDVVRAFFAAAKEAGMEIIYEPQLFPQYHESYYAAFVRDPDGHSIEAVCHTPES